MIVLQQLSGHNRGRRAEFAEGPILLGRSPDAQLRFDAHADIDVSARHAVLEREGDGWILRDVGSRNGTFVGGKRIRERALEDRDEIELGHGGPRLHVTLETSAARSIEHADTEPGGALFEVAMREASVDEHEAPTREIALEAETVALAAKEWREPDPRVPPPAADGDLATRPETPAAKRRADGPNAGGEVERLRGELRKTRLMLFVAVAFALATAAFVVFGR